MAAYGTRYIGGPKKLYYFSMRIEYPYWKTVSDIADQIHGIVEATHRDDDTYVFNDDGALSAILDCIGPEDKYIYYDFVTDRETCKKLEKLRKYWGFQVEKTGGRWI